MPRRNPVPRDLFLQAIEAEGGTGETTVIADRVGCTRETAYRNLLELEAEGKVTERTDDENLVWELAES